MGETVDFLPKETDVHIIQDNEDELHIALPTCECGPRFVGLTARLHRVFEHQEVLTVH